MKKMYVVTYYREDLKREMKAYYDMDADGERRAKQKALGMDGTITIEEVDE